MVVKMDVFEIGDVYIDFPFERVKFRFEHATRKVYRRFYGEPEDEIPHNSNLYHEAISFSRYCCGGETSGLGVENARYSVDKTGTAGSDRHGDC